MVTSRVELEAAYLLGHDTVTNFVAVLLKRILWPALQRLIAAATVAVPIAVAIEIALAATVIAAVDMPVAAVGMLPVEIKPALLNQVLLVSTEE